MTAKERRQYWITAERMRMKLERKYTRQVKDALDAQASSLIAAIEAKGMQAINEPPMEIWDSALMDVYARMFTESFTVNAKATYNGMKNTKNVGGIGRADQWTLYVQNWLRENGLKLVVTITGNSRELYIGIANQAIQEGIDKGLGAREIQTLITSRLKDANYTYSGYRALRIARTETVRAANEGHMKGAEALPFLANKTWIAAKDARTRRIPADVYDHWDLDGQVVDLDEPFISTSRQGLPVEPMMPGDISSPAGFTINCRCRVAFIGKRDRNGRLIMKPAQGQPPPVQPSAPAVQLVPAAPPPPAPKPKPAPKPRPKPKPVQADTQTNWLTADQFKKPEIYDFDDNPLSEAELNAVLRRHNVTRTQLYAMAGGLGSKDAKLKSISISLSENGNYMDLQITSTNHYAQRTIDFTRRTIENDNLKVVGAKGEGVGLNLFLNEVKALQETGFKSMEVYAAGQQGDPVYNGYYTWARFGYDSKAGAGPDYAQILIGRSGRKEKTLFELMSTEEGREWWKKNGKGFAGHFDLTPDSRNVQRLREYAAGRGIKVALGKKSLVLNWPPR